MAIVATEEWIARNPATGDELGRVATTPAEDVAGVVGRAIEAQRAWAEVPWKGRREVLRRWWATLARDAGAWADAIVAEIGKPRIEAQGEVITTLDCLRWTVRHAGRVLAGERIGPGWQRMMLVRPCRLGWRPLGVIGMLGTWNYPLYLNAPAIGQALAAGNAVVWKPSELAPLVGLRLQRSLVTAGFPEGLTSAVFGGPEVGRALIESRIAKGMFTGGVENGRRVLEALGRRGIPALAELSGFDPAVILPDAPIASTTRSIAWAAFVGAGQACVAVKRAYVVGDPIPWAEALADRARLLRLGDPGRSEVDVGPLISEAARDRFQATIRAAIEAGARVLAGGESIEGPGAFHRPTVLLADDARPESVLAGCFGPVVIVRGVADAGAAVDAANAGPFGLAASVWGRDRSATRAVADRLEAGMVSINDAVTPSAHASAPFGGIKASGFGRVHGPLGLREFVAPRVVVRRGAGGFRPQQFPYSDRLGPLLAIYRGFFHPRA